jgi:hypothetical protein
VKRWRGIITIAAVIGVTLLIIEVLLRAVDPWGLSYFDDLARLYSAFAPDAARDYALPDGDYSFTRWTAAMRGGARRVPNTPNAADCTLVVLGDSVAFGYAVNDEQTWVNGLAQRFPAVQFVNAGTVGYNSQQVLATLALYPQADALLYFVIDNDVEDITTLETLRARVQGEISPLWLLRYGRFAISRNAFRGQAFEPERFFRDLDAIITDPRVRLAAYADQALTLAMTERGYALTIIPMITDFVSFSDRHANATGQAKMAEQLAPLVSSMASDFCENGL